MACLVGIVAVVVVEIADTGNIADIVEEQR